MSLRFKDMGISYYTNSKGENRTSVYMNLSEPELKDLKEYVDMREALETGKPITGSLRDLELRRDSLKAQVDALTQGNMIRDEIKMYEGILAARQDEEERKKYPHAFGGTSDLCMYCSEGAGFFGRNEGKPCVARYEESKKQPPVVDIKLVLRKRGPSYRMIFRKLDGGLLPPGKYTARIAETVEVDCERFNFNNVVVK